MRQERPLEGIRVLEIGTLIAEPFAVRLMADSGAEVVKVETPVMEIRSGRGATLIHGRTRRSGDPLSRATSSSSR